jgi:hypothetical protein
MTTQVNSTVLGTLGNLTVTGNINIAGNISASKYTGGSVNITGNLLANTVSAWALGGTITTASQTNITSVGNLTAGTWSANTITPNRGGTGLTASGNSGNVLTSNGTAWSSTAPSAGQYQYALYTSGTADWTCPAGVTRVKATIFGGGGGGGQNNSGGFGGKTQAYVTTVPLTVYTITIGAGGTGIGALGETGGTTSFGALLSATGGAGGTADGEYSPSNGTASINQFGSGFSVIFSPFKYSVDVATVAGTSPQVWTSSTAVVPGAGGQLNNTTGSGPFGGGRGGMGGALLIEYIG